MAIDSEHVRAELDALLAEAAEEWAHLPADDDGRELALALARKAYARGYLSALSESPK